MNQLIRSYWFNPQIALLRQIEAAIINRFLTRSPSGPSIDIGCGSGRFALALSQHIDEGMDLDQSRIPQAAHLGVYKDVRQGKIEDLGQLHPNRYALIVANSVLEHTDDPGICLGSLSRALKTDGILCLTVPTAKSESYNQLEFLPETQHKEFILRFNRFFQHRHLLEGESWTTLCRIAGLRVEESACYLFPETRRILDALNPYQTKINTALELGTTEANACADLLADVWESWFAPYLERETQGIGRRTDGSHLFLCCTRL